MSAIQPPPGWWLASDGRWYAPELHPDARPSTAGAAPPAGGTGPSAIGHLPTSTHRDGPTDGRRRALRSPWVWGTGLVTVLILAVLVATGLGGGSGTTSAGPATASGAPAGAARSGSSASGTVSHSGAKGAPSGAAVPPTTPPTTAPPAPAPASAVGAAGAATSTGTASEVAAGPPGGDVSVSQCVVDPTNPRRAVVNGTVVNHDTHPDDYTITLTIAAGGQTVGSAFVTDDQVANGATSPWSASGTLVAGAGTDLICTVSFVGRVAS